MVPIAAAVISHRGGTRVLTAYRGALSLVTGTAVAGLVLASLFTLITPRKKEE